MPTAFPLPTCVLLRGFNAAVLAVMLAGKMQTSTQTFEHWGGTVRLRLVLCSFILCR
jgi:hypothetical protein